jgi:hypothetical protein
MRRISYASTAVVILAIAVVGGCGSSGTPLSTSTGASGGGTTTAPTTSTTSTVAASTANYKPKINPSQFTTTIDNKWFPLAVGDHRVYTGTRDGAPIASHYTVLPQTKNVMGVKCVVVRDVVTSNHSLIEKTTDWYAQNKVTGDVWYFGENTAEYENGVVTSTAGTWEAGVDNAQPGITMEANPKVGDTYRQEFRPGIAEDRAKVLSDNQSVSTPSGTYNNLIETLDINPLDPSKIEHKWFAAGVGFVHAILHGGGHSEEIKLAK